MIYLKLLAVPLVWLSGLLIGFAQENPWLTDEYRAFLDQQIETNRTSMVGVRVYDEMGRPLEGAKLHFELLSHDFIFGTAMNVTVMFGRDHSEPYRAKAEELFNGIVFGNALKWSKFEDVERRKRLKPALEWVESRPFHFRGHAMIWAPTKYRPVVPTEVQEAIKSGNPQVRDYVKQRSLDHIHRIGTAFKGRVAEWDVLNEQMHEPKLAKFLNPDARAAEAPIQLEWFRAAQEADPNARLFINDFDVLRPSGYHRQVLRQAQYLVENGAPIEGVGAQGHFWNGSGTLTAEETWERFKLFSDLGLKVAVTEFDMFGGGWERVETLSVDENKALFFEALLRTTFAFPEATGFTLWGFWDRVHWKGQGTLFYRDWSPKPALAVWQNTVLGEWKSDETVTTTASGTADLRLYHGTYQVTVEAGGETYSFKDYLKPEVKTLFYGLAPSDEFEQITDADVAVK